MLKCIYADNYMCLVDFEYVCGRSECLAGRPGSGRSAMLDLLEEVQRLLSRESRTFAAEVFPHFTANCWRPGVGQRIEIELEAHECGFRYCMETEFGPDECEVRLVREELRCDDQLLFSFADGMGRLHFESGPVGEPQEFDGHSSALKRATNSNTDQRVQWFLDWWRDLWLVQIPAEDDLPRTGRPTDQTRLSTTMCPGTGVCRSRNQSESRPWTPNWRSCSMV